MPGQPQEHHDDHPAGHGGHGGRHAHGAVDPSLLTTERGIRAVQWSFAALFATALFQAVIVVFTGSVALLADTIHNVGDAATAVPLWIAFRMAQRKPSRRFTYGYGRVEDLAGVVIVLIILLSAAVAAYESVDRFLHPRPVTYPALVAAAAVIGFLGNEAVARFRIKVGTEIGSAALVADGQHARVDGLTSLAVLLGAVGAWLGYPLADPVVGLGIALAILRIVWDSGKSVFTRLLDGVDPEVVDEILDAVDHAPGVRDVSNVRVRWSGHRMLASLDVAVEPGLSVVEGHAIAAEVRHRLLHRLRYLADAVVHVDPEQVPAGDHHRVENHAHDDLPTHSH